MSSGRGIANGLGTSFDARKQRWTPAKIATELWLDAANLSTISFNGSNVAQWNDLSGKGRHATQGNEVCQPLYESGKLVFNGTQYLDLPSSLYSISNGANSCFIAAYESMSSGGGRFLGGEISASTKWGIGWENGNSAVQCYNNTVFGFASSGTVNMTTLSLTGFTRQDSNITCYFNGLEKGSASAVNVTLAGLRIGSLTSSTAFLTGGMSEIILVASSLNQENRQKIEGYLAWKWNISSKLPVGHPYKNLPPYA